MQENPQIAREQSDFVIGPFNFASPWKFSDCVKVMDNPALIKQEVQAFSASKASILDELARKIKIDGTHFKSTSRDVSVFELEQALFDLIVKFTGVS